MGRLTVIGLEGIGEIEPGDDIAKTIKGALTAATRLVDGDIVVVTHKIVSKAEGRIVDIDPDDPDAHRSVVEREAAAIVRRRDKLVIAQTRHGFICANAGVDRSNVAAGKALLLPVDPDRSARRILARLKTTFPVRMAVIISDTFGRPWRSGLTDVAIGVAGMLPIDDLRGTTDSHGNILDVTQVAIADEVAAAADLVMGKATGIPVAIVRGVDWVEGNGSIAATIRPPAEDLFR